MLFNLQNAIRECGGLPQLVSLLVHPNKAINIKAAQVLSNLAMNETNQESLKVSFVHNTTFTQLNATPLKNPLIKQLTLTLFSNKCRTQPEECSIYFIDLRIIL